MPNYPNSIKIGSFPFPIEIVHGESITKTIKDGTIDRARILALFNIDGETVGVCWIRPETDREEDVTQCP